MAAQPVVQKVSSELEVILVAGLFVPVRKSDTYLPEFKGRFFFSVKTGVLILTEEEKCH